MELLQLRYFISAAETENFSDTAKKYLVPTSNISQTIKRLEKELGCPLFDRSANRIKLNKKGKTFYDGIKNALISIEQAKESVCEKEGEISGEIKLSICTDRRIVTKAIQSFIEIYPNVTFKISHVAELSENSNIIITDRIMNPDNYSKQLIIKEDFLLAAVNPIELCENSSITEKCETLKKLNYISMPPSSSLYRNTVSICNDIGFTPNITITTDDPFYIRKYVEMGLGVAFIPVISWQGLFDEKVKFYSVGSYTRSTYVFRKKSIISNRTEDEFCRFLIEETATTTQKH